MTSMRWQDNPVAAYIKLHKKMVASGKSNEAAASAIVKKYPALTDAVLDMIGSWPSSEVELRALQRTNANHAGRGGASRKRTLASVSAMRRLPVIFLTENPPEDDGVSKVDLTIAQPGAADIAKMLSEEGIPSYGSDWDYSGPEYAGTHVYIRGKSDRDQLIRELRAVAKIEFADYGVPRGAQSRLGVVASKREQRARRAAQRGLKLNRTGGTHHGRAIASLIRYADSRGWHSSVHEVSGSKFVDLLHPTRGYDKTIRVWFFSNGEFDGAEVMNREGLRLKSLKSRAAVWAELKNPDANRAGGSKEKTINVGGYDYTLVPATTDSRGSDRLVYKAKKAADVNGFLVKDGSNRPLMYVEESEGNWYASRLLGVSKPGVYIASNGSSVSHPRIAATIAEAANAVDSQGRSFFKHV